ncbi:MAG: TetR/AcrR family transcriptional regulator, transcriptional repressor for nem operon [Streptomycetaceae bacterium]|nr:TetR/AcrR family transcriptional regulator, transcriptional repressor for nem operon [Streptomycetaceae bacterium]
MARIKEFDPDAALDAALELFWRRGYEATSMADLVEHVGVARAGIYGTFGSKRDLYLRALDRYRERVAMEQLRLLSRPGPALAAVRELVERCAAEVLADEVRRGCFAVNSAVELGPIDPRAVRRVEAGWASLETGLTSALMRAQAQGELGGERDPVALARFLLVVIQGLRVLGRTRPEPGRVRDAVEQALRILE